MKTIAIIINFACHPVAIGEYSYMLYERPLVGPGTATLLIETAVSLIDKLAKGE